MEALRNMKLNRLKKRIAHANYEVDADAVAEAIVRRLTGASAVSRDARSPAAGARVPQR